MKSVSKIALFLFSFVFTASLSFAGGNQKNPVSHGEYPAVPQQQQSQQSHASQGKSTSYGEIKLKHNQHIVAYLPKDVRSYQPVAYRCNEQGQRAENDVSGGCLDFVSASTHSKWRVRFVQPEGAGERIYQVRDNDGLILHAQFDAKDVNRVIFASAEASKYAATNGSGETQIARQAPTQSPPQQQARADCGHLNFLQRAACEAGNNAGLGAAIGSVIGKGIGK